MHDEVHTKKSSKLSSHLNARQKKIFLLHDAVMKTLKVLADVEFVSFQMDGVEQNVWRCYPIVVSSF